MPISSMNRMSEGLSIRAASNGPNRNATNARINTMAVATMLLIAVNLRRKTVRFTTPEI